MLLCKTSIKGEHIDKKKSERVDTERESIDKRLVRFHLIHFKEYVQRIVQKKRSCGKC